MYNINPYIVCPHEARVTTYLKVNLVQASEKARGEGKKPECVLPPVSRPALACWPVPQAVSREHRDIPPLQVPRVGSKDQLSEPPSSQAVGEQGGW